MKTIAPKPASDHTVNSSALRSASPANAREQLTALDPRSELYASQFVERILAAAQQLGATDIHLCPTADVLDVALRIDGVLEHWGAYPKGTASDVITRFKVIADLLTYRTDVPQEGRVRDPSVRSEIRVSSFPTLHGEKIAIRLFRGEANLQHLEDLGLPVDVRQLLDRKLFETSGAVLITGPAGSGKTTTAYACLREVARITGGSRNIATLEDPIEVSIPGVAQTQVRPQSDFDLAAGLRALLRQDPEVILIGEMRDPTTASTALQASLTGQLVLTTFHASSAAGAVNRLLDMGLEPYMLRSGILAVICQRLVRKLCACAAESTSAEAKLGLPIARALQPQGCAACHGSGYNGRILLVESLTFDSGEVAAAILSRSDANELEKIAVNQGMQTRWDQAIKAVEAGLTSAAEVRRVLGFSDAISPSH
jgi:general secretion pathway protein E